MLRHGDLPPYPFHTRDLLAAGVSRKALDTAVRDGVVRRVLRGAYVRSDVPDSVEVRALAAGLVTSPRAVLVDRTAAWLHGVDVLGWHEHEVLPPLECFVLRGGGRARRAGVYGGTRDLLDEDTMRLHGVVVTTPVRTALDLACALPEREGLAVLDAFLHAGLVDGPALRRLLARYYRRRGVVRARWLVAHADARAESQRESWVRFEIIRHGLPCPEPQHRVVLEGWGVCRLDLAYPKHRVAVEYDGAAFHTAPRDRQRDLLRRERLEAEGWIVIVLDGDAFAPGAVERWTAEIGQALRSRRSATARTQRIGWRTGDHPRGIAVSTGPS